MLAVHVMLDGFDPLRGPSERRGYGRSAQHRSALGWGRGLALAFRVLHARAFSGFYLPLMLVLWLLLFRALGIELRHHVEQPLWRQLWDVAFGVSSMRLQTWSVSSCAFLAGMLGRAAAAGGLTIFEAATERYALEFPLYGWIPAIALALADFAFYYRSLSERLSPTDRKAH